MAVIPQMAGFWQVSATAYILLSLGDALGDGYCDRPRIAVPASFGDASGDGYCDPARSALELTFGDASGDGYVEPPIKGSISATLTIGDASGDGYVEAPVIAARVSLSIGDAIGDGYTDSAIKNSISATLSIGTATADGYVSPAIKGSINTGQTFGDASGDGYTDPAIETETVDLAGFAALPTAERTATENAAIAAATGQGYTAQSVIDVITSGQIWINTPNSLYSNTTATTLIAGVAGNPVQAWKDWCDSENFIEGTTPPTYQSDGVSFTAATNTKLDLTSAKSYGAQNNRTFIFLANFTTGSNQDFFGNRVTGSNDAWILRKNPGTADVLYATIGRDNSTFGVANGSLLFLRTKLSTNSTILNVFVNGSNTFNDTTITAAAANPDPQVLRLGRQNSASQDATFKLRALFAYSGTLSDADAAKAERFINAYFGLSLL